MQIHTIMLRDDREMKLKDIAHLLPPGAMEVMALLEAVGQALEADGEERLSAHPEGDCGGTK